MVRPKDREKFNKIDNQIWKKTRVDGKGQTTLPKKLRQRLGLFSRDSKILWICVNHVNNCDNEFLIRVGVKK